MSNDHARFHNSLILLRVSCFDSLSSLLNRNLKFRSWWLGLDGPFKPMMEQHRNLPKSNEKKRNRTSLFRSELDWEAQVPVSWGWLNGRTDRRGKGHRQEGSLRQAKSPPVYPTLRAVRYLKFRFWKKRNEQFLPYHLIVIQALTSVLLAHLALSVDWGIMSRNPEFYIHQPISKITFNFKHLHVWHSGCDVMSHSKEGAIDKNRLQEEGQR